MAQPDGEPAGYGLSAVEAAYDAYLIESQAREQRRGFQVVEGERLEITDDMRRRLPPGAIGRIIDAAFDAPTHVRAKAALQKQLASGAMGTGGNQAPFYNTAALEAPYSHLHSM